MSINKINILKETEREVNKIYPQLLALAQKGFLRNPIDDYLLVNYPPRSVCPKLKDEEKQKFLKLFFEKINNCEENTKISVYIHIPFCTRRCSFCHFYLIPGDAYKKRLNETVDLIKEEIYIFGKDINKKKRINSIFFGGGSPSLLSPKQVSEIINKLKEVFVFDDNIEMTLEIHPEILRLKSNLDKYYKGLKKIGITRLNFGFQTSNETILKLSNRGHSIKEAITVFKKAKKYNFTTNIDLIWGGLILDTTETFFDSLNLAFLLKPDTVSTYFMWLKPGTLDYLRYSKTPYLYPNWIEIVKQRFLAYVLAEKYSYNQELVDWFKKESGVGFQQQKERWGKNNTILLPFGPGTYGWVFSGYQKNIMYYNFYDLNKYTTSIKNKRLPVERMFILNKEDTIRRHLMFRLKSGTISADDFGFWMRSLSKSGSKNIKELFHQLEKLHLLSTDDKNIKLTKLGCLIADEIAGLFAEDNVLDKMEKTKDDEEKRYDYFPNAKYIKKFKDFLNKKII